jgi:Icc-related predicted phosphoesterase
MSVKICFSSDLHGNCEHLRQILATSLTFESDVVILGGDLAPRGSGMGVDGGLHKLHHFLPHKDGKADWASGEAGLLECSCDP